MQDQQQNEYLEINPQLSPISKKQDKKIFGISENKIAWLFALVGWGLFLYYALSVASTQSTGLEIGYERGFVDAYNYHVYFFTSFQRGEPFPIGSITSRATKLNLTCSPTQLDEEFKQVVNETSGHYIRLTQYISNQSKR